MLLEMEKELKKQKNEIKNENDDKDENNTDEDDDNQIIEKEFHELSREERLQELTNLNESSSKDWAGLKSLTGANASGWKFEDSYYGNFNVGRRPSMDTAWGRRVYDQVKDKSLEIFLEITYYLEG